MGEYTKDGMKLGTCEAMYYTRFSEMVQMKNKESEYGSTLGDEYLKDGIWFRFPWPTEDNTTFESRHKQNQDYNHCETFSIPKGLVKINHKEGKTFFDGMCIRIEAKNSAGGYGFNAVIPCPASDSWKALGLATSPHENDVIAVYMQIIRDGKLQTVFRCPYCEQTFRVSDEELGKITKYLKEEYRSSSESLVQYMQEIADRIQPVDISAQIAEA